MSVKKKSKLKTEPTSKSNDEKKGKHLSKLSSKSRQNHYKTTNDYTNSSKLFDDVLFNPKDYFYTELVNIVNPLKVIQTDYFDNIKKLTDSIALSILPLSNITEIICGIKSSQLSILDGLAVTSEVSKSIITNINDIKTETICTNATWINSKNISLDFEKKTSSDSKLDVIYNRTETIKANVSAFGRDIVAIRSDVNSIKSQTSIKDFLKLVQDNPFIYFKISSLKYKQDASQFIINNQIYVDLSPYTRPSDLCMVLFSGHLEIGELWTLDSIQDAWRTFVDNEKADSLTWKQILTAVDEINTAFAKKTTKDDLVEVKKPQMLRLNPNYFKRL
jgi:hypothetical protein